MSMARMRDMTLAVVRRLTRPADRSTPRGGGDARGGCSRDCRAVGWGGMNRLHVPCGQGRTANGRPASRGSGVGKLILGGGGKATA